jgi:hypothetical protein
MPGPQRSGAACVDAKSQYVFLDASIDVAHLSPRLHLPSASAFSPTTICASLGYPWTPQSVILLRFFRRSRHCLPVRRLPFLYVAFNIIILLPHDCASTPAPQATRYDRSIRARVPTCHYHPLSLLTAEADTTSGPLISSVSHCLHLIGKGENTTQVTCMISNQKPQYNTNSNVVQTGA